MIRAHKANLLQFGSRRCLKEAMDTYHTHERYVLNDYRRQVEEDEGREPKEQSGNMFLALRAIAKLKPKELSKQMEKDPSFGCEDKEFDEHEFLCNLVGHEEKVQSQKN